MWPWILLGVAAAGGPSVDLDGSCPGPVALTVAGMTPLGNVVLLAGAEGEDLVPAGPCRGEATGLSALRLITTLGVDGAGRRTILPTLPPGACSAHLQALDLSSCALSPAIPLGAPPAPDGVLAVGSDAVIGFEGVDGTGVIEWQCQAWDGDVCSDMRARLGPGACDTYVEPEVWHGTTYYNAPEERICPIICGATTEGEDHSWTTCAAGGETVSLTPAGHVATGYAADDVVCDPVDARWREGNDFHADVLTYNIRFSTYGNSTAALRVSCAGWIR